MNVTKMREELGKAVDGPRGVGRKRQVSLEDSTFLPPARSVRRT
jgi:hypothetical protein